jgi:hypothetical protein
MDGQSLIQPGNAPLVPAVAVPPSRDWSSLTADANDDVMEPPPPRRSFTLDRLLERTSSIFRIAEDLPPSSPPPATINDPRLCQIRTWDVRMCQLLSSPTELATTLFDWNRVQAGIPLLDCLVQGYRFVIEWVVFWLQNRCKKTNLTLDILVQHEQPSFWFTMAVDLYSREWSAQGVSDSEWTSCIEYWKTSTLLGPEVEPVPFVMTADLLQAKRIDIDNGVYAMFLEIIPDSDMRSINIDSLEMPLLQALGIKTSARLTRIRHSRIRYVECLALAHFLRRTKRKDKRILARYERVVQWLKQFLEHGCACSMS